MVGSPVEQLSSLDYDQPCSPPVLDYVFATKKGIGAMSHMSNHQKGRSETLQNSE